MKDKQSRINKVRHVLYIVVTCVAVCLALNFIYSLFADVSIREQKNRYRYMAINEANFIAGCIDKVVVRTYTIREMINENQGGIDFFDDVADTIKQSVRKDTGINLRNLAVAPDGIVAKVEPLETNESLIGFNFTDESKPGNKEAIEAYRKAETIITNPFPLVQGGIGMAARTPVFVSREGVKEYWGLVTATIDYEDILRTFKLSEFTSMNLDYSLWTEDEDGERIILDGTPDVMDDCISQDVTIYNLIWHLDVKPADGWTNGYIEIAARSAIFLVSMMISALVFLMMRIKRDRNTMRHLAEQDSLTHCYSRHYLNSVILDITSGNWKKKDSENEYSLAIIDVDRFKVINDRFGHVTGDRALIAISDILKENLPEPKTDKVVRFGGDEFVVFFNNKDKKELRIILHNILSQVEKVHFDDIPDLSLSISIGAATPEFFTDGSYQEMMKYADEKLYRVKESGRNNYAI